MEPIKYIAIRYYEKNLGDHGELWNSVHEIREGETIAGLMARLPPGEYFEIREVKQERRT
jgi:hypothetical protein